MKADGGAAFPVLRTGPKYTERGTPYGEQIYSVGGMTLRDYFAGHVMAHQVHMAGFGSGFGARQYTLEDVARLAYEAADALLAERERTGANNG